MQISLADLVRVTAEEGWSFSTWVIVEIGLVAVGIWSTVYYLDKLSRHFDEDR